MRRRPQRSTLFPHPTLSRPRPLGSLRCNLGVEDLPPYRLRARSVEIDQITALVVHVIILTPVDTLAQISRYAPRERNCRRSEEHTSELQSRQYLVCRLLLEK